MSHRFDIHVYEPTKEGVPWHAFSFGNIIGDGYAFTYPAAVHQASNAIERDLKAHADDTVCPECKGTGSVGGHTGFHYDQAWPCSPCGGTGYTPKEKL